MVTLLESASQARCCLLLSPHATAWLCRVGGFGAAPVRADGLTTPRISA